MQFEWDEEKRQQNIAKHKVDFVEAVRIFYQPIMEMEDTRVRYLKMRMCAIGSVGDKYYMVVYTNRNDVCRVISAWVLNEKGKKRYEAIFSRRH